MLEFTIVKKTIPVLFTYKLLLLVYLAHLPFTQTLSLLIKSDIQFLLSK